MSKPQYDDDGPFRAEQLKDGDRYELSRGHTIYCLPGSSRHASRSLTTGSMLDSDPDAEWAGVDAGYSPESKTLRAPDIAVGPVPHEETDWIRGVPPLAVEIADRRQDEDELEKKIQDLLSAGTQYIWVVRMLGPRRVEEYRPQQPLRTYSEDEVLHAPGILRNPVPVRAFYERGVAHEATLRNLLQRHGYESLEAIRTEGRAEGHAEGRAEGLAQSLFMVLKQRNLAVSEPQRQQILACRDSGKLEQWLERAFQIDSTEELFE